MASETTFYDISRERHVYYNFTTQNFNQQFSFGVKTCNIRSAHPAKNHDHISFDAIGFLFSTLKYRL